ncbi:MAG: hypothetical protein ABI633_00700 [Burkholderiales bacterium]
MATTTFRPPGAMRADESNNHLSECGWANTPSAVRGLRVAGWRLLALMGTADDNVRPRRANRKTESR